MKFKNTINSEALAKKIAADPANKSSDELKLLDEGWHLVHVAKVSDKTDRNGDVYTLVSYVSDKAKAWAFDRLYFEHENVARKKRAYRRLSQILTAAGMAHFDDTEQLVGLEFMVKIQAKDQYRNVVDCKAAEVAPVEEPVATPEVDEYADIPF